MSNFFTSTITRKFMMSLTGIFLMLFLVMHLSINLTLFGGADTFNAASEFMGTNPLIFGMQFVLAAGFIYHIYLGIVLTYKNWKARGSQKYYQNKWSEHTPFSSRTMIWTGVLVLIFLFLHMGHYFVPIKTADHHIDHYELVTDLFKSPLYTGMYVIWFIALAIHLSHAFQSSFQSLGLRSGSYVKIFKVLGKIFFWVISIGFSAIAIWFFIQENGMM